MPSFYDKDENVEEKSSSKLTNVPRWWLYMILVYIYYVLSCGLEGFFQSMTYTYGLLLFIFIPIKQTINITT